MSDASSPQCVEREKGGVKGANFTFCLLGLGLFGEYFLVPVEFFRNIRSMGISSVRFFGFNQKRIIWGVSL